MCDDTLRVTHVVHQYMMLSKNDRELANKLIYLEIQAEANKGVFVGTDSPYIRLKRVGLDPESFKNREAQLTEKSTPS